MIVLPFFRDFACTFLQFPFFPDDTDLELFADRENGLGLCVINGETQRRHSQASVGDSEVAYAENLLPPLADQHRSSK